MPEPIQELTTWSLETITVPDGYDLTSEPDLTRGNLQAVIIKLNEVIIRLNMHTHRTQEDTCHD